MKCVAEILEIRASAEVAYQEEQKRLDELAKIDHVNRIKQTIAFCETEVNDVLVEKAEKRSDDLTYVLKCRIDTDRLDNKIILPLESEGALYANGEISYCPSTTLAYDYETFVKYLEQFCYKITEEEYRYREYGSGLRRGTEITVSLE